MPGTLAIDLGSSTTVVAWQDRQGPPGLLPLPPYSCGDPCVVPSLLWLEAPDAERPLIGRQVLEAALADGDHPGLCRDFKRHIGAPATGPSPGWLSAERAGALLLEGLWRALPAELVPERLVLTAPIETYRGYRAWLERASRDLAVPELALVDEPTAAAIGAGLPPGSRVLVVDMGGGTIDLSLVALEGGEGRAAPIAQLLRFAGRDLTRSGQSLRCARVIGKAGVALGGRDIDRWIAAHLCPDGPADGALLQLAERIKCQLSEAPEARQIQATAGSFRELTLSRPAFERLLEERGLPQLLDGLLEAVLAAARREGLGLGDIDAVLPVGGSSRIPLIRRWLESRCPGVPLRGERPVEAVALGALALTPGVQVRDVLARGVSLRCWDRRSGAHRWHPLFVAGQSWPTEQPLELVLACSQDGQEELELVLGEPLPEERAEVVFEAGLPVLRERPAGAAPVRPWSPSPLTIPLASPGQRGVDRLRLRFSIDAQARLLVAWDDLEALAEGGRREPLPLGPVR
ncbi:Hsp70 family protein [Synechococcus sp. FACHB-909]|uniref:Hsp70 family protein n=1 Tax=Synechococcus sp. FACHB-909 TaxID=2692863 RepID=UPI001682ED1B|nr:Hsp70 family protein [Synechococcus sp. FACHB-909]MBD2718677.1 Hsp70 family protein [Synechococcus sp. FACHB-909]